MLTKARVACTSHFNTLPNHPFSLPITSSLSSPAGFTSNTTDAAHPDNTAAPAHRGAPAKEVVDEDPDERQRKFLERNRAAATRCRQKRKVWVMSLEKKAEELTQTNMQLQVQATVSFRGLKGPVYRGISWPGRHLLI